MNKHELEQTYTPKTKKLCVPYVTNIQHGVDLLRNPRFNKGLAFTLEERRTYKLEGLLPPYVITQDVQAQRVMSNIRKIVDPLDKYQFLVALQGRNEKLFYKVLCENITELMPVVYTPTVGLACQQFGHIYRQPRGMYITINDKGRVFEVLENWPDSKIKAIVFTDGERILGLGDLGAYGMGIPIGKLALYTACAGVDPRFCLPVVIDVGTNNENLLNDPMYIGLRQKRVRGDAYDELITEFIDAVKLRFGKNTLLQFEDFGNANAARLLKIHQDRCCTFNDDIQGTASVGLAGIIAGLQLTGKTKLSQHKFLFYGAGSAGIGIGSLIAYSISKNEGIPIEEARKCVWFVDSQGLVVKNRAKGGITVEKEPFAHEHEFIADLYDIVEALKPTALIGVAAQPNVFTQSIIESMAKFNQNPMIFALSNPTSKAECTAESAYTYSGGRAIFSSGSPFPEFQLNGKRFVPGQGNNSYIFPGLCLAIVACGATRVTDDMFLVAAETLASLVAKEQLDVGCLYPPMHTIRQVSVHIAHACAEEMYRCNLATYMPKPSNLLQFIQDNVYSYEYDSYVLDGKL